MMYCPDTALGQTRIPASGSWLPEHETSGLLVVELSPFEAPPEADLLPKSSLVAIGSVDACRTGGEMVGVAGSGMTK